VSAQPADHTRGAGPGTRAVHAGLPAPAQGEPFLPGPTFAGPYHLAGDADAHRYGYQRYGNPTWTRYEAALSELEGGPAIIFPAGMAAVTAVLMQLLEPGDRLVAPSDAYPGVRDVAASHLVPAGIDVQLVPTDEAAIREAIRDGASLVWVEVPSNPALDVVDIAALAEDVHAAGALLAVDNTLATPLSQRPLELGADLSMSSATKALTGHADLNLGHVASRDDRHAEALLGWRSRTGAIPGPFEVWLAHRSLATLDVRLERQCSNAMALAEALQAHDGVSGVRYPGLPGHPGHEVAARQMDRFGMVLGFELADAETAQRFLASASLVAEATSFGGVHTTAERRARWGTDAVSEGFVRMSAGLEDEDDLRADVLRAVDAASSSRTT
jgi:cystathionine gamma-lyase